MYITILEHMFDMSVKEYRHNDVTAFLLIV
nr:MAG TPA_asm: hypothetical protein [Caudoviricetes sp.]